MITTVLFDRVVDQFVTTIRFHIQVDIRHGYSRRIQEPLERKVVFDGINVSDFQQVATQAPRRTTSTGATSNPLTFRKLHQVPHDQEVCTDSHRVDDTQLVR